LLEPRRQRGFLLRMRECEANIDFINVLCNIEAVCTLADKLAGEYGITNGAFTYPIDTSQYASVFLKNGKAFFGLYDGNNIILDCNMHEMGHISEDEMHNLCIRCRSFMSQLHAGRQFNAMNSLCSAWEMALNGRSFPKEELCMDR